MAAKMTVTLQIYSRTDKSFTGIPPLLHTISDLVWFYALPIADVMFVWCDLFKGFQREHLLSPSVPDP